MPASRKSPPILSIIVPVHNHARTIGPVLHALKPFRDRNAEIIVVDGGSNDDTAMLARPLADQVIRSPLGLGRQMNEGAKVASGFIFLFLRPETRLPLDADTQVMYGRSRDTAVWGRFDLRIQGRHMLLPLVARWLNWRSRASGIATGDQAIFVQRESFFRVGGFSHLPVLEDVDLCERLRTLSPPICVTSRVTVPGERYDRYGVWKTLRDNSMKRLRYRLGADPKALAERYSGSPGGIARAAQMVSPSLPLPSDPQDRPQKRNKSQPRQWPTER
ncbi:MAG: TIGR04283 family arsenosugar biosynthesis glycosyltransferase [Pseudorhodoplanes sp.]|uniref:TIGR04283 family arsenosugar biosynthesis glycosyltransferase n=1 Tax=Pseudorhodoplanes sp. TaxID=1934341 RepID=UPI003D0BE6B0